MMFLEKVPFRMFKTYRKLCFGKTYPFVQFLWGCPTSFWTQREGNKQNIFADQGPNSTRCSFATFSYEEYHDSFIWISNNYMDECGIKLETYLFLGVFVKLYIDNLAIADMSWLKLSNSNCPTWYKLFPYRYRDINISLLKLSNSKPSDVSLSLSLPLSPGASVAPVDSLDRFGAMWFGAWKIWQRSIKYRCMVISVIFILNMYILG